MIQVLIGKLQTGLYMCLLEQRDLALQDFTPLRRVSVLPIVILVTVVPAALRSLTSSSRVVLGWSLTFLMIDVTPRGEILHGAPDRGRLIQFVFLPFSNNCTNSILLLTKMLANGLVAHSSLVQSSPLSCGAARDLPVLTFISTKITKELNTQTLSVLFWRVNPPPPSEFPLGDK